MTHTLPTPPAEINLDIASLYGSSDAFAHALNSLFGTSCPPKPAPDVGGAVTTHYCFEDVFCEDYEEGAE